MAVLPIFMAAPTPARHRPFGAAPRQHRFLSQAVAASGTILVRAPLVMLHGIHGAAVGLVLTAVLFTVGQWGCLLWLWRRQAAPRLA